MFICQYEVLHVYLSKRGAACLSVKTMCCMFISQCSHSCEAFRNVQDVPERVFATVWGRSFTLIRRTCRWNSCECFIKKLGCKSDVLCAAPAGWLRGSTYKWWSIYYRQEGQEKPQARLSDTDAVTCKPQVVLADTDPVAFKLVLSYIYTDRIRPDKDGKTADYKTVV